MAEITEFAIVRASQLTCPNKDWTHYRLGLKLRGTKSTAGVSLAVLSQGRIIDSTFLTPTSVKFLVKSPIVGIKVLDGDTLKKRLQITFESEGNYNMFTNKIRQWLGIEVHKIANIETPSTSQVPQSSQLPLSSQLPQSSQVPQHSQALQFSQAAVSPQMVEPYQNIQLSQHLPQASQGGSLVRSQVFGSSQIVEPNVDSQTASQSIMKQFFAVQPNNGFHNSSQSALTQNMNQSIHPMLRQNNQQSSITNDIFSYPTYSNPMALLAGAAEIAGGTAQSYSQDESQFLNSTLMGYDDTLLTTLFSGRHQVLKQNVDDQIHSIVTGEDIYKALNDIPFSKTKPHRVRKKKTSTSNGDKIQDAMTKVIEEIVCSKENSLNNLSDRELMLKMGRVLKSKSFVRLLKRVETLLQSLPENDE